MRAVIIGATGQLGQEFCRRWPGHVIPLGREQCDLTWDLATISAALERQINDPSEEVICINCAAYNFVDRAESEPQAAFAVNAWGVQKLAAACRQLNWPLVHVSTDYVFGLDAVARPLEEEDPPGPVNLYGLSKLMGEYLTRQVLDQRVLIVRTCGLYGRWGQGGKGRNFVETMFQLAQQGQPLRVVADQRCTPSYAADVAQTIIHLIQHRANGIYHVVNSGECSWFEFAQEIFRMTGQSPRLIPISSVEYPAAARRPSYSVLATHKLQRLGVPPLRPWNEALAAYLRERSMQT